MKFTLGRWLVHALAAFTTLCTLALLVSGGLVTSHGAGLAVPDWPNSFGYNMFALPFSRWLGAHTGGVFYEHSHRLIASGIGVLTILLATAIFVIDERRWMKVLGVCAVVGVCIQGVLGGLRVTTLTDELGIFHGMLAQSFFVLLGVITVATSRAFLAGNWAPAGDMGRLRGLAFLLVAATFLQLGIAATMRHEHAGLSIPDFPLAYGRVIPDTRPEVVAKINAERFADDKMPTTAGQIWLQMAHRGVAVVIAVITFALAGGCLLLRNAPIGIRRTAWLLVGMVVVQIALGAWTIWSDKAADIATAHMALGALFLFVSSLLAFRLSAMHAAWTVKHSPVPSGSRLVSA